MDTFGVPKKHDKDIVNKVLKSMGIDHLKDKCYTEISGGERQMVLICRALAQEPEILILDEPTSNLDFGNQARVLEYIIKLVEEGLTVVMTSHQPEHAFMVATKVVLMKEDGTIDYGLPENVITEESMKDLYGIDVIMMDTDIPNGRKTKAKPDFILSYGTIDKTAISNVEKIQKQLKIPIVMVDSDLEKSYKAYEFVGDIVNEKERAKVLADYSKAIINEVKDKVEKLSQKKVRIYYAEGAEGLQTEGRNSIRTLVSDMTGGLNVAGISTTTDYGKSPVSIENVLAWCPEVILVGSDPSGEHKVQNKIMTDKRWAGVKAVKSKKVYEIPHGPFNWYDRPDSVNRLIGLKWMGNLFYPDIFSYDMKKEAKNLLTI